MKFGQGPRLSKAYLELFCKPYGKNEISMGGIINLLLTWKELFFGYFGKSIEKQSSASF
jgi:hypothetical protein